METKILKSINLIRRGSGASLNLFRYAAKSCDSQGVVTATSYGASDEHPMSIRSASDGGRRQNRVWKYAAMLLCVLMLGIGNAWADSKNYYASLQISKAGTTAAGKVYVAKTNTKPSSEVTTVVTSDATSSSGGSMKFYYWVDVTSPGYYVTLSGAVSGTYNGNTGEKSVSLKASTSDGATKAYTATATFSEITINNGTASPIDAKDNSATATTNTCTVTYSTKGDNTNDFKAPTVGSATGHGTFTAALGGVTSAGAATVNVTFKGDGTYGGNVEAGSRSRTSSAVVTLTSVLGNNKGTCTVTASFPNIIIGDGSFDHMSTINTVSKSATATFPVQWADDVEDFSASFGSVTGGGVWTVDDVTYTATDAKSGTISVAYTFNPNSVTGDHSAVLTLAANANAGGASKTLTLTAEAEALAEKDASIGETKYTTLAEAITAANGMNTNPTVKILRNVEGLTSALEIKKPMTIDLNSFTVSGTLTSSVNKLFYLNTTTAVLTINDSRNGGKISATGNAAAALYAVLADKGSVVLTKGDIEINNTNTGASANAIAVCIMAGARFGMTGGNLNAVAAGTGAYGVMTTTNPTDVDMIGITGGTITAAAATTGVGIYCKSSSTTLPSDPTNANVALSGVTIDASATGATAHAVQTDAGVILGINSGTYNATVATTTARAVLSKGYTAVMNGTFNATAGTTDANAIRVEAGIVAVRAGLFNATTVQRIAHAGYVANGAKLLTYGGTFHGKSTTMIANGYATGTQVVSGGTLEAQGGTFIGEAANTGLGAAQTSYAIGVFANTGSNVTLANATLRGLTDNTHVNGAYALYTSTVNPVSLTNCTLEATSTDQYAYGVRLEGGATPLTMNNCTVNATAATLYAYGFYQNNATSTIDVTGSTFIVTSNGTRAYGIYVNAGTSFSATDCDFTVRTLQSTAGAAAESYLRGIFVAAGKQANLTGCTFNVSGHATYSTNAYGLYISGSVNVENTDVTVSSVKSGYAIFNDGSTTAINISSGKFSATTAESNATAAAAKQQLYGGYYVHNTNLAKYLPEGYMIETLTAGTEFNAGYKYHVRPETVVNDPVCKIGSTGYATLEEAIDFVNKNSGTAYTIYMVKNYTLPAGDYTLPAKATLLVPYKSDQTSAKGSSITRNKTKTTPSLYRKLTFASGVNMTVKGTIEVGGEQYIVSSGYTGSVNGAYGRLVLDGDAHIEMENGSNLMAWGFVTGSGDINAKSGATLYEQFQLLDMKGGGVTSEMINNNGGTKVFPITHYAYQNIESEITYRPGSNAIGCTGADVQQQSETTDNVHMVGNLSSGSLFLMDDEGVASDTWVRKKYNPTTDRMEYTLNNTAILGSINVNLQDMDLTSGSYILPIASNMTITMKYGTMTINQSTYFMPGSVLNIEKEAKLTIPSGKELYFVDKNQWVTGYSPAQYVYITPYSPSFNNGAGGLGADYSPRKGMRTANTNLPSAELFVHGNVEVAGALYTTANGANIHSTNEDAGTIIFNSVAANKNFYQCNSTCGEGKDGPGSDKCSTIEKGMAAMGWMTCYYWRYETWPCTSAQLKNETGFTSSASNGAGTYVYKNGTWTKVDKEGCFTTETDGSGKHYYANPSDIVEVTRNTDNSYRDTESGFRRFVWDTNCEWWEVETTPTSEGYYKAIKADHNDRYNYYEYNSSADYWQIKNITVTWNVNGVTTNYSIGYGTHPKYLSASPTKASTATDYYTWLGWTKGTETGEFFAKDAELPVATENTTYYAYFKADKFTFRATFNNYDGSLLETKLVAAGETPVYEGETPVKPASTSKEYTFTGWNPALAAISNAPVTYTAQFSEKTREYTVQWVNYNGTVLKEEKVAYGTTPTAPVDPTRPNDDYYTYTFDTWSPAVGTVTGNQTYTATYNYEKQVPKYTATFKIGSKTVYAPSLKSGDVPVFDGTIPTKTADAQYTYTFDGWSTTNGGDLAYAKDEALPALTGDVTYYAHFATTTNNYRIIWKSENGKVTLETDPTVPYGTTPSFDGATPTKDRVGKTGYEFDGWSASIGGEKLASLPNVTEDNVFYAHFLVCTFYDITFNANGHGTAPTGYEAIGGSILNAPEAPTETGYTFGGWYKESACTNVNVWNFASDVVNSNTTLYAKWTANPYTITFDSNGGSAVASITQGYETSVTAPANPTRTGYTFAGWDPEVPSTMPLNGTTCVAQWTPNTNTAYTVNHYKQALDGSYAETPDDTDNLTGTTGASVTPERKSYDGFDAPAGQTVTILADGSRVVTYKYTRKSYNLSWVTDGDELTGDYTNGSTKFGAAITAPNTPTKTGYTFAGWSPAKAETMPAVATEYTATWTINQYTLTVLSAGEAMGTVTGGGTYDYNTAHTITATPNTGFKFVKWNDDNTENPRSVTIPAENVTYTATFDYDIANYTVKHWQQNIDNDEYTEVVADRQTDLSGTIGTATAAVANTYIGFTLKSPIEQKTIALENTVVDIYYNRKTYTIAWVDGNGTTIETDEAVKYGATPVYSGETPTKTATAQYTYTFSGWEPALEPVTSDATYTAEFSSTVNKYHITWYVKLNGETLESKEEDVEYGTIPFYGSTPTKEQTESQVFTFSGWTPEVASVTGDQEYIGSFNVSPRSYTITFVNDNGVELWHSDFGWDSTPSYGGSDPVSSHTDDGYEYTFAGWKPALAPVNGTATYTAKYDRSAEAITVSNPETVTDNTSATTTTVENGGTLTVGNENNEVTLQSNTIIVESGGLLDVADNGSIAADVFIIQATTEDQGEDDAKEEVQVSGELSESGSKNLNTIYYDLTRKHGTENFLARVWYAVAVPWAVEVPTYTNGGVYIKQGEEFVQQRLGATFDLITYDGYCRATQGASADCWVYLEDEIDGGADAVMVPGKLYMIYLTQETSTIRFKKKVGGNYPIHTNTLTVSAYGDSGNDANWNGIANPATYRAYMNVAVEDGGLVQKFVPGTQPRDGGRYLPIDLNDKQSVGQPFFVQVASTTESTIQVTRHNPSASAPRRVQAQSDPEVRYAISIAANGKLADRLYIQTAEEKEDEYIIGKDMSKMSVSSRVAQIWVNRYDSKLCLNTAVLDRDKASYPLGIYAPQAGEYKIFAPADIETNDNIYLTLDDCVIWNLTMAPYYASLEQGTTNRYGLKLVRSNAPAVSTDVENLKDGTYPAAQKIIIEDKVYILRGEKLYTITGQLVQ